MELHDWADPVKSDVANLGREGDNARILHIKSLWEEERSCTLVGGKEWP